MGRISRETIERIFETARIEEVVGDFVNLKRSGSSLKGLSPFTQEKTPSFYVVPAKQIFKDFSSGKGGSVVTFLMEHEHFTYPEALRYLAKRYGIEIEEDRQTPEEQEMRDERESLYVITDFANRYFRDQLWETETGKAIGLSYFRERGFTDETIRAFELGYSPEDRSAFANHALKNQYSPELLEKSGLAMPREDQWTDRFRGRVIFPIHSMSGRVLGFGARILRSDAKAPKYLNSPETDIYHKSKVLYGLFQSKRQILQLDRCLLVEGYTDVLALHQAGIRNVVSSSGTALTAEQVRMIKRLTPNVTILYDGDPAGIRASFRGIDLFLEEGLNVKVLLFPDGDDPDSYSRKHRAEEIVEFLENNSRDFITFKTGILLDDAQGDPVKKAGMIRDIVGSVARIPDGITRDVYLKECSRLLDMEEQVLAGEMAQMRKRLQEEQFKREKRDQPGEALRVAHSAPPPPEDLPPEGTHPVTPAAKEVPHYLQERDLVRQLLNHGHELLRYTGEDDEPVEETVADFILAELEMDGLELRDEALKTLYNLFVNARKEDTFPDMNSLFQDTELELHALISDLLAEPHQLSDWSKRDVYVKPRELRQYTYTKESVLRYKRLRVEDMENESKEALLHEDSPDKREELLQLVSRMGTLKRQIDKALNRVV